MVFWDVYFGEEWNSPNVIPYPFHSTPFLKGAVLFTTALFLLGCSSNPPPRPVKSVDLQRYAGKWHEIARYPNWFQNEGSYQVTAQYTPNPDGSIGVINSAVEKNGKKSVVRGRATVVPGSGNARLKVSFGVPVKGDYWIIGLDPGYQWALVGHPSRNYLWILARSPRLSTEQYEAIVQLAVDQGYSRERIQPTPP